MYASILLFYLFIYFSTGTEMCNIFLRTTGKVLFAVIIYYSKNLLFRNILITLNICPNILISYAINYFTDKRIAHLILIVVISF